MKNSMDNVKKYGEVFTPHELFEYLLKGINFEDPDLLICEPSFGDGRILFEIKRRLLKYHSEEHIISNMLCGFEIQKELYDNFLQEFNPRGYKHRFYNVSAIMLDGDDNPIKKLFGRVTDYVGNPPYNRNLAKKEDVSPDLWKPSGYTTKLAYAFFICLGEKLLKKDGNMRLVIPCSFTHNENMEYFREFLKSNFNINKIKILPKDAFKDIMIRTCIFDATKGSQTSKIKLERNWQGRDYVTDTFYNEYNEIPLFIGEVGKSIYNKVMSINDKKFPTAYKGWNGADSYAKHIDKDRSRYEYEYVHGVNRNREILIYSSKYPDKVKAKKNKKKNNVGTYDRLKLTKIMINEVMFNSFETTSHLKYILIDRKGKFGASPKNTVICLNETEIPDYITDIKSPVAQAIMSMVKDYNHNDSKMFQYLPFGLSKISLSDEEKEFLSLFNVDSLVEQDLSTI